MTTKVQLSFGYNGGIGDGVDTAWGCRAILDRGLDIPYDRQCAEGPRKDELLEYLNIHFNMGQLRDKVHQSVPVDYPGMKNGYDEYVLYEDRNIIVKANTQRSFGYVYICAYFKGD